ncbi:MAG: hypothetical protein JNM71_12685 [Flavobacterium lindanitolerans]|uniref:hypothetical protein n=1 Tax=Flavobacterium lindanitolerans TaxID=428988 RepID=UPI001A38B59B|nr:hypothetical protein [Flavobacterium lindanitolerans]MBL7868863.1 hypothetical protein [Flavobacterium lindanitolerans]
MGKASKIKQHNDAVFLSDIKKVTAVLVWADASETFLKTTKREVLKSAENNKIIYRLTNDVYKVRRLVMVIY